MSIHYVNSATTEVLILIINDRFLVLLQALGVESKVQSEIGHASIEVTSEAYQHGSKYAGEAEGSPFWPGQGKRLLLPMVGNMFKWRLILSACRTCRQRP